MKKYRILFRLNASRIMDFYTHDFNLAHEFVRDIANQYKGKGDIWLEAGSLKELEHLQNVFKMPWILSPKWTPHKFI